MKNTIDTYEHLLRAKDIRIKLLEMRIAMLEELINVKDDTLKIKKYELQNLRNKQN